MDGSGEKTFYINNICSHEAAYEETGNQAVSYTTGVPAMIGSAMMVTGKWDGDGVFNMEEMDPDPFMEMLNSDGLPWTVEELPGPVPRAPHPPSDPERAATRCDRRTAAPSW